MKLRRNILAFARGLDDSSDYIKDLKETENRSKKAMQKKIAIMLILMVMAELDAHRVLDSHGGLGKNFVDTKWFKLRKITITTSTHFDILIGYLYLEY